MTLKLPPQFLPVRLVPRPDGKTDKYPCDSQGRNIDAHNPAHWMDEASARQIAATLGASAGAGVGFTIGWVLTEADPYFFIDLDKHWRIGADGVTWEWSRESQEICALFAGAAMEFSSSRTGLHILGQADQSDLASLRNRWPGGYEFYFRKRFIAFGFDGWVGDPNTVHTAALHQFVPRRPDGGDVELLDGPSPEYTGPTDDDELIARMCNSAPSVAVFSGTKAHPRDLWTGNAEVLGRVFPAEQAGQDFDHSKADAALMGHLAFWTGRDMARMDRLFRRSALMRAKYAERPENYARPTIIGAAQACQRVYSRQTMGTPAVATLPPAPAEQQPMPDQAAGGTFGEYLQVPDMLRYFAGCVYIRNQHQVMVPGGHMLSPAQFKTYFGGHEFQMERANGRPSRNAFEAFTENRAYHFPKAEASCFRPDIPGGSMTNDGRVNCYFPLPKDFKPGDVTPFLDLLARMIPNERDRMIILSYAAFVNQNPGKKVRWAPVLVGTEGNGKTLLMRCIAHGVGERYVHFPGAQDLSNPFNSYVQNKLFIGVDEIHMEDRRDLMDALKPMIADERVEIQPKGVDKYMIDNPTNWWFNTNHKDAIQKTADGRRYAVFFCAQQSYDDIIRSGMGGSYFPNFVQWLNLGGFDAIAAYLMSFTIPVEFDPGITLHRAPDTSTTDLAIRASLGPAEQEVVEAIESEQAGFKGGWVSSGQLGALLKDRGRRMSPHRVRSMLTGLGYIETFRSPKQLQGDASPRPVLWIRKELFRPDLTVDDFLRAQGGPYMQDLPPTGQFLALPGGRA